MPREYGKAWFSMFTDDHFTTQPNVDKFLYMTLLGQPSLNYAGVTPINLKRWRKAIREGDAMPTELEAKAALVRLERNDYVFTDDDTGEVLIRSFMRRDEVDKQPNVLVSGLRAAAQLESPKLAAVLRSELARLTLPTVNGESLKAVRLRKDLPRLFGEAVAHLETLSEGLSKPFAEPFAEDFPEGFEEGLPRPGEMEPLPKPFAKGLSKPPVVVEVEVAGSPSRGGYVGGTREHAHEPAREASAPSPRCPKHPDGTDAPCRACGDARTAREAWDTEQARHRVETARAEREQQAALVRRQIEACDLCDADGYLGTQVCNHNPAQAEINRRGAALARAALTKPQEPECETPTSSNSPTETSPSPSPANTAAPTPANPAPSPTAPAHTNSRTSPPTSDASPAPNATNASSTTAPEPA
ncbi:hypothetical protein ACWFRB_09415 [Rhodococcus sp. NPDC055112]